jgi:hypothetical protein
MQPIAGMRRRDMVGFSRARAYIGPDARLIDPARVPPVHGLPGCSMGVQEVERSAVWSGGPRDVDRRAVDVRNIEGWMRSSRAARRSCNVPPQAFRVIRDRRCRERPFATRGRESPEWSPSNHGALTEATHVPGCRPRVHSRCGVGSPWCEGSEYGGTCSRLPGSPGSPAECALNHIAADQDLRPTGPGVLRSCRRPLG